MKNNFHYSKYYPLYYYQIFLDSRMNKFNHNFMNLIYNSKILIQY